MAGRAKLTPLEVFEENIADAQRLLDLTSSLLNKRQRRMRRELRETFGDAMGISQKLWPDLDCVESVELFIILKPKGKATRNHFDEQELRPLLRQAIVAVAAAVESYVAEKACCYISEAMRSDEPPRRLLDIPMSLEDVLSHRKELHEARLGPSRSNRGAPPSGGQRGSSEDRAGVLDGRTEEVLEASRRGPRGHVWTVGATVASSYGAP